MSGGDLHRLDAAALRTLYSRRALSPLELVDHLIARVERLEPELDAFTHFDAEATRADAKSLEARLAGSGPLPPLFGLPVPVKDLVAVRGLPFTRGSKLFEGQIAAEDAPVVARLRQAGAIVFGKTTTSEFGWKAATGTPLHPETRNPWDRTRTAGGSSGGAAAAVAAGLCPLAIGTDAAGSVRIPASFCGIYALKPSLGRLPNYPPSPVGPMSHIGPMTRTAADAAMFIAALAGPDDRDVYSLPAQNAEALTAVEGLRIGWSADLGFMPVDGEVRAICEAAAQLFRTARCEVVPLEPALEDPRRHAAMFFEAGAAMAVHRFPSWREAITPGLVPVVERGLRRSAVELAAAQMMRGTTAAAVAAIFDKVDLLVLPATPVPAFAAGLDGPGRIGTTEIDAFDWMGLTLVFNMVGCPAASIPCGFTKAGLPVGLQIVGPRFADWRVLQASRTFEELSGATGAWPEIARH
jgi:aspartyl-tRNA(Asn)/glutamyl-tRNA(Gln) amidotransferase subunit A